MAGRTVRSLRRAAEPTGLIIGGPNATINGKYAAADTTLKAGTTAQWIIGSGLTYTGSGTSNRLAGHDTIAGLY